ncbi:unnamed protein product [Phytophthora lilii]|uniref:Unnamed protein product n=1 Tax=Phytophthora lilii TaxID=2077276 RepID=A0A9W6THQ7_9STRA|nr:unnamed protein product [Phytophthora lilii]
MHRSHFLLVAIVVLIACFGSVATAEDSVQIDSLVAETKRELASDVHRHLKGVKEVTSTEEERGITTPSFRQFFGAFRLPKSEGFSKLPLIKQANVIRKKVGKKVGDLYLRWARKRYESNPNNFM